MSLGPQEGRLHTDAGRAFRGVYRLYLPDANWRADFDFNLTGFLRSFIAVLIAIFPSWICEAALRRADGGTPGLILLGRIFVSSLLETAVYGIGVYAICRILQLRGWMAFLIVLNWSDLAFSMLFASASGLSVAGPVGVDILKTLSLLILWPAQLLFSWNAARKVLSADMSVAVLLIVLDLGLSLGVDQLVSFLFGP